jgi:hypothetical protein
VTLNITLDALEIVDVFRAEMLAQGFRGSTTPSGRPMARPLDDRSFNYVGNIR